MKQHPFTADIAVIGGGAAGLMAALHAACGGAESVLILERHSRVGKKLLATGNGRCNLTNLRAEPAFYHGKNPEFCRPALGEFSPEWTTAFFDGIGVFCKEEEAGKIYPYSDQAASVLDCLRAAATESGRVRERCGFEVKSLRAEGGGFRISGEEGEVTARRVILCTGGKAAPNLCSDGSGYRLLEALGHRTTPLFPALVQIRTDNRVTRALKGIKFNGTAVLLVDGRAVQREAGEILFAEYGLSGPPIFSLSRRAAEYGETGRVENVPVQRAEISLNLFPNYAPERLEALLLARQKRHPEIPLDQFFTGMVQKRIGQELLKTLGFSPLTRPSSALSREEIKGLAHGLSDWRFEVRGGHSFQNAQVTAGGIRTDEAEPETMASKIVRGLYLCGEILDVDGDCGGFNLQWAWSSGALAGRSAARSLKHDWAERRE